MLLQLAELLLLLLSLDSRLLSLPLSKPTMRESLIAWRGFHLHRHFWGETVLKRYNQANRELVIEWVFDL